MGRTESNSQSRLIRLVLQWFISQPLSFHLFQRGNRALAIGHFPIAVAVIELGQIEGEMFLADMMEGSDDAPL